MIPIILLLLSSDVVLSLVFPVSQSQFIINNHHYLNGNGSRQQSSLHASHDNNFKIKLSRRVDIQPLHASSFSQKEETSELNSKESFEVSLMKQRIQFEDLLKKETKRMDLIADIDTLNSNQEEKVVSKLDFIWLSRLLLLVSAALTGTNFTFVKVMNENIPALHGTMIRFTIAAIATSPWLFRKVNEGSISSHHQQDLSSKYTFLFLGDIIPFASKNLKIILAGLEVGCWTAIGYISQSIGLETIQASTSAFICSLAVVVVPILDIFSGTKISYKTLFGAIMAVIGVGLLELDNLTSMADVLDGNGHFLSDGDIFTLIQPITFGIGFWRMEHAMKRYPKEGMKLTAVQLCSVAILGALISCLFFSDEISGLPSYTDIQTWFHDPLILKSLLWTSLINTALTIFMETASLQYLSAMETTILLSTEPVFGLIFAALMLNESFGCNGIVGALTISVGCIISNLNFTHNSEHHLLINKTKDYT